MNSPATLLATAACLALVPAIAMAQATDTFEVASVKQYRAETAVAAPRRAEWDWAAMAASQDSITTASSFTTPYALITWAYGYNKVWGCSFVSFGDLLTGGPSWIRSERFEIQALMPEGSPFYTLDEFMKGDAPKLEKMLQALLADRFNLEVRRETKDVPGYALVPGKGGTKLAPSIEADKPTFGTRRQADQNGQISHKMIGRKVALRDFSFMLLLATHRPVIDRTGLMGEYNFDLEFAPFDSDTPVNSIAPSLFTALQEQLGLRLESTRVPLEGLVIDHVERPSEN